MNLPTGKNLTASLEIFYQAGDNTPNGRALAAPDWITEPPFHNAMPESHSSHPDAEHPVRDADTICAEFRRAIEQGGAPNIEAFLAGGPPNRRVELLAALLRIELQHLQQAGQSPRLADYLVRFPEHKQLMRDCFGEHLATCDTSQQNGDDSVTGGEDIDSPENVPSCIGRFQVIRLLGEGSFGRVFLAYDDELDQQRAIKVPYRQFISQPESIEPYRQEARIVARLDTHPHIVRVCDVGNSEAHPFFVISQYIEGEDLKQRLKQGPFAPLEAARLAADIAEALRYAHSKGVVHRDVKPSNILLDQEGKPYVADFGIALRSEETNRAQRFIGTPAYMSPEQARGDGDRVDGRSDIFALGIVFYELLTGQRPFQAKTRKELLKDIEHWEPKPPRELNECIPRELESICLKALSKKMSDRYTTAGDMAEALQNYVAEATEPGVQDGSIAAASTSKKKTVAATFSLGQGCMQISVTFAVCLMIALGLGYWFISADHYVPLAAGSYGERLADIEQNRGKLSSEEYRAHRRTILTEWRESTAAKVAAGDFQAAANEVDRLLASAPENKDILVLEQHLKEKWLNSVADSFRKENWEEALESGNRWLAQYESMEDPATRQVLLFNARVLARQEKYPEAVNALNGISEPAELTVQQKSLYHAVYGIAAKGIGLDSVATKHLKEFLNGKPSDQPELLASFSQWERTEIEELKDLDQRLRLSQYASSHYSYPRYHASTSSEGYLAGYAEFMAARNMYSMNQAYAQEEMHSYQHWRQRIEQYEYYRRLRDQKRNNPTVSTQLIESHSSGGKNSPFGTTATILWPPLLQKQEFAAEREVIEKAFAQREGIPATARLNAVAACKSLNAKLRAQIQELSPTEYVAAKRHIELVLSKLTNTAENGLPDFSR